MNQLNSKSMLGVMIVALGAILLVLGYRASGSPVDQLTDAFTGRYTDKTMWYIIGGLAAVFGGGLLVVAGSRSR